VNHPSSSRPLGPGQLATFDESRSPDHSSSTPEVPAPLATFHVVWAPDRVIIKASGELDVHSVATLDLLCDSLIVPGVAVAIRLDASAVTFIDCGGVRGILAVAEHVREAGCSFAVTTPSDRAAWLLDMCHVDVAVPPEHPSRRVRGRVCRTRVKRPRPAA
jgi:anti-anti-sigma factor